jgi:hypothetical protein
VYGDAWKRSPVQIQGSRHFVNECKKGYIKIGCIELTFEQWQERFEQEGKNNSYTETEIQEYKLYIELIISINKLLK